MHQILYVSVETKPYSTEGLEALLAQARRNNTQLGITGILIYYKKHFFQILEGERETVFELFRKIRMDERHSSVILVLDQEIEERSFKDWTMAFLNLNEVDKTKLANYSEFLEKGFTSEVTRQHLSFAQELMIKFKDSVS